MKQEPPTDEEIEAEIFAGDVSAPNDQPRGLGRTSGTPTAVAGARSVRPAGKKSWEGEVSH